jgi:hypothetical protein
MILSIKTLSIETLGKTILGITIPKGPQINDKQYNNKNATLSIIAYNDTEC